MSDEQNPAEMAGDEPVVETHEAPETEQEGQDQSQTAEDTQGDKPDESEDKPKRETAKERRERDKAYKQRLRDEAKEAQKQAEEAEARRARILEAGQSSKEPVEKDFDDYTEYVAAKAVWRHSQQAAERDAGEANTEAEKARQRAQAIQQQEQQLTARAWQQQMTEARTRYADFDAVALNPEAPISDQVAQIIVQSDQGADLAYHLGSNPALAARISKLEPIEAAREIGRLEATLSPPRPRTETKAPDPINPVKPRATASKNPASMSMAEYKKWREGK